MKINEFDKQVTQSDIDELEKFADKIFAKVGIDVNFTRHFLDRVNDERNGKPISMSELTRLFKQEQKRWGKKIAQLGPDEEAVMKDLQTDINLPFALRWDDKNNELDLIAKTVMRKKNFRTPNPEFPVENVNEERGNPFNGLPDFTINNHIKKLTDRLKEIHKEIQGKPKADMEEFRDELYKINYKMKQLKSAKPLSSIKMNEDFGSVPPLAELILMAVVAKTSVDVLIGMFKVALKTGKGLKKLNDLRKRVSKMGKGFAKYAMPESIDEATRDELLAKLQDQNKGKMMKAALDALHRLATSKGDKQSIGGYAFDIARAFNGVDARELEKTYRQMNEDLSLDDMFTPERDNYQGTWVRAQQMLDDWLATGGIKQDDYDELTRTIQTKKAAAEEIDNREFIRNMAALKTAKRAVGVNESALNDMILKISDALADDFTQAQKDSADKYDASKKRERIIAKLIRRKLTRSQIFKLYQRLMGSRPEDVRKQLDKEFPELVEAWSNEYKKSIDCSNPKGFSQKAHCAGRKKKK